MIGRVNAGGGGALQSTDAILRVIAPAGSTVTISKSGVSKSDLGHENAADNTLYDYYFIIHASQFDSVTPWTVTATLGTQSISDTIIINSADEYDVIMAYDLYLIKDGDLVVEFDTVGMKSASSSSFGTEAPTITDSGSYITIGFTGTSSASKSGIAYTTDKFDLSKYSKLYVVGTARNNWEQMTNLSVNAWTSLGTYQDENRLFKEDLLSASSSSYVSVNKTIDISSLSASANIGINASHGSSYYSVFRATDIWLEV